MPREMIHNEAQIESVNTDIERQGIRRAAELQCPSDRPCRTLGRLPRLFSPFLHEGAWLPRYGRLSRRDDGQRHGRNALKIELRHDAEGRRAAARRNAVGLHREVPC